MSNIQILTTDISLIDLSHVTNCYEISIDLTYMSKIKTLLDLYILFSIFSYNLNITFWSYFVQILNVR